MEVDSPGSSGANRYKRASRKGATRRFACEFPGCHKIYSRAEHLQRHQLNRGFPSLSPIGLATDSQDNPKEIFDCDVEGCDQKFVRLDLLLRHKKRHTAYYTPRNRVPSFTTGRDQPEGHDAASSPTQDATPSREPFSRQHSTAGPHDSAILLTPESNTAHTPTSLTHQRVPGWRTSVDERAQSSLIQPKETNYFGGTEATSLSQPSPMVPFPDVPFTSNEQLVQANFAAWLFDPQSTFNDFGVTNLPFIEGGLESTFNNNIHYDYESLTSRSPSDPTPPSRVSEVSDDYITEPRRLDMLHCFTAFRKRQPAYDRLMPSFMPDSNGDVAALTSEMFMECLSEFWEVVSPRLPIVHQYTFSPNRCPIFLLFVMMALGAASLRSKDTAGRYPEHQAFADSIISSARWEILTSAEAAPPAGLWIAQSLLLLEFYEKMYSSRRFHERAHIYHSAFLTLLRRGSPLIGRGGSESPPEPESLGPDRPMPGIVSDAREWWVRWAEIESMHRVVFAAFMLDIIHAAMFGHAADMAAHEIRLPLPCDDSLWSARSPDILRQLDSSFRMYGVKQVSFLDGLKSALHGKEVKTHSFGRMIILSGLLSVGWHLKHRESQLKWLELRAPTSEAQDNWRKMLLGAFDKWKGTFDLAMSDSMIDPAGERGNPNGPISSASVLFHLAHISLHTDIVDFQVYAGAKRLVGRKVSTRDYTNAVNRMSAWAKQASSRHAVLHAFKLLYRILVEPYSRRRSSTQSGAAAPIQYSMRNDTDPHRPWIMYYAVLTIWAFVQGLGRAPEKSFARQPIHPAQPRIGQYLSTLATMSELSEKSAGMLHEVVPELLDVMERILVEADTELLVEARARLKMCREMVLGGGR